MYKILSTTEGANAVGSASLLGARIVEVDREGIGVMESRFVDNWGTDFNYKFNQAHGLLIFNPLYRFQAREKVYVLYKT